MPEVRLASEEDLKILDQIRPSVGKEIPKENLSKTLDFVALIGDQIVGGASLRFWTDHGLQNSSEWPNFRALEKTLGLAISSSTAVEFARAYVSPQFRTQGCHRALTRFRQQYVLGLNFQVLLSVVNSENLPSLRSLSKDAWKKFHEFNDAKSAWTFLFKQIN